MDKKKQFADKLDDHLHNLAKNIVFNRNPLSIEFHKADFFSKVMNDFEEIFGNNPENIEIPEPNIDETKEVLLKVAKEIRRMNRLKAPKKPSEPKLKIL
jgi:hypothetical protein